MENQRIAGVMHAFRTVYRVNGMQGFAKGLTVRVPSPDSWLAGRACVC